MTSLIRPGSGIAILTGLLLVSLASGTDNSSAGHGGLHKCLPPRAKTVLRTKLGRFYERGEGLYKGRRTLWACTFATGRVDLLTNRVWFPPPAIDWAGSLVGYVESDIVEDDTDIILKDFSGPKNEGTFFLGLGLLPKQKVGSLRITEKGGVAWIQCPPGGRYSDEPDLDRPIFGWGDPRPNCTRAGRSVNRVYKHDSTDEEAIRHLLDRGRGIDPRSLRLRGSMLTWRKDGRRRTATLD